MGNRGFRAPASWVVATLAVALSGTLVIGQQPEQEREQNDGFKFRTRAELINVTATVTDSSGRFVGGLTKEDFVVYEDGQPQTVTLFSNERVPVSLGIALDTSGSMLGEKFEAAHQALDRFLYDLLDKEDEIFVYRFSNDPTLVHDWTTNRDRLSRAIGRIHPDGGTAMLDCVAEAVPHAESGQHRKKAVVLISDGNDTASQTRVSEVKQLIRESEVLVYAIGIDGESQRVMTRRPPIQIPLPFPIPGRRSPWPGMPQPGGGAVYSRGGDRVNVVALREMTDDSGGRTEIIRSHRDLSPATANIADELSKQYYLGYASPGHKDNRWHSIRVEVRDGRYRVRARRGYVAT